MKKLLLITGDLATGKSTFSRILSERHNCTVFCKDKIKELLADEIGFRDREENLRLSRATMEIMIANFNEISKSGSNLILEANFRAREIERLHNIAAEKEYAVLTLVLRADVNILYQRFMNRINYENRHPVHISGFDGFESFKTYVESGRKEEVFGQAIDILANNFTYQSDEKILSKIDHFMGVK